eukprot:GEMP01010646.1.p1 GENE.GEMP01010646.1~~GEMP01010646.1.p1  ORF type:complete len:657 (+),score=148.36 GEMP01010646.1:484-2454(+)
MRKIWIFSGLSLLYVIVQGIRSLTPVECTGKGKTKCLRPAFSAHEEMRFELCYESHCFFNVTGKLSELAFKGRIDVPIKPYVRRNGTATIEARLSAATFVHRERIKMTRFRLPLEMPSTMLLGEEKEEEGTNPEEHYFRDAYVNKRPVTHWRRHIGIRILDESRSFPKKQLPHGIRFRTDKSIKYMPTIEVDDLFLVPHDWAQLSTNTSREAPRTHLDLQVQGLLHFSFINMMKESLEVYKQFGISDDDLADVKLLFSRNRLWHILMEYIFGTLSMFFATMAFKNDIGFWKNNKKSTGLSVSSCVSRFVMQLIIFLHLYNFPTISRIILVMNGLGLLIDGWKVSKVVKGVLVWRGIFPTFQRSPKDAEEDETDTYDRYCFKMLSLVLFPVLGAYAIHDLMNQPQTSWWSWFIENAAHGVYVMGFIFMVPQLYINYKLKSVAHLPWRVMMYKTFNTFVDDIFAWFIADVPLAYRIATFRDDICFFVFLYQRFLYRTDYGRANEFGRAYEEEDNAIKDDETPLLQDATDKKEDAIKEDETPLRQDATKEDESPAHEKGANQENESARVRVLTDKEDEAVKEEEALLVQETTSKKDEATKENEAVKEDETTKEDEAPLLQEGKCEGREVGEGGSAEVANRGESSDVARIREGELRYRGR